MTRRCSPCESGGCVICRMRPVVGDRWRTSRGLILLPTRLCLIDAPLVSIPRAISRWPQSPHALHRRGAADVHISTVLAVPVMRRAQRIAVVVTVAAATRPVLAMMPLHPPTSAARRLASMSRSHEHFGVRGRALVGAVVSLAKLLEHRQQTDPRRQAARGAGKCPGSTP